MPRGPRLDAPGLIFHVMNRGTARRTMFERTADLRFFLSRLAYAVRRGEIEVLAYAILTTHFHLVLRSLGFLSRAMRRMQSEYTQRFNRPRDRDGALQRGRFASKLVSSRLHLVNVVPYVDENPVQAGLVDRPIDYPWGSAFARAHGRHGQWLSDDLAHLSHPAAPPEVRVARAARIDARLAGRGTQSPYEDLIAAAPERVSAWMKERAELADGTAPGLPVAGAATVEGMIAAHLADRADASVLVAGNTRQPVIHLLRAGLLRDLAGVSFAHIARALETTDTRAKRLYQYHLRSVAHNEGYRTRAATIVARCLDLLAHPRSR